MWRITLSKFGDVLQLPLIFSVIYTTRPKKLLQRLYKLQLFTINKNRGGGQLIDVYHIECEEELPKDVFDFETVGITAGASTPDELINAIENKLVCGIY